MGKTHIQWTNYTFNPWEGCTKVSPGCAYCYAETRNQRFSAGANWGKGAPRRRTSVHNWNEPLRWNRAYDVALERREEALLVAPPGSVLPPHPNRPRVFCASLADWLDDEVPIEWLADLLKLIRDTPNLDWQLLTKRPENFTARLQHANGHLASAGNLEKYNACPMMQTAFWIADWLSGKPPANVWIGTSVEDQTRANIRIPQLLVIPARIRFLSCEPLLGPVDITAHRPRVSETMESPLLLPDWVICGGESGPSARPMHIDWARRLRDQCGVAKIPFFFKQWGEWAPIYGTGVLRGDEDDEPDRFIWLSYEGKQHESGAIPDSLMIRPGKIAAGRTIEGNIHDEFPVLP